MAVLKIYKLTKGTLSRIRSKQEDINALIDDGYKLDGQVNDKYEIINDRPEFKAIDPLDELRAELVSLGCAKSTAERYKNEGTLLDKIAEYEEKNKEQEA